MKYAGGNWRRGLFVMGAVTAKLYFRFLFTSYHYNQSAADFSLLTGIHNSELNSNEQYLFYHMDNTIESFSGCGIICKYIYRPPLVVDCCVLVIDTALRAHSTTSLTCASQFPHLYLSIFASYSHTLTSGTVRCTTNFITCKIFD